MKKNNFGLYVHLPFCAKVCPFCDFAKTIEKRYEEQARYINHLILEIQKHEKYFSQIETVYLGGGTPNWLPLDLLERVLSSLQVIHSTEFSIEINCEFYTPQQGDLFKRYGINRVSCGVQTFDSALIAKINRGHNFQIVQNCFNDLREKGIMNLSLDLMYGLPGQTWESLMQDYACLISLHPTHFSYYSLIVENHTFYGYLATKHQLPDQEELEGKMFDFLSEQHSSYHQYEISNFCLERMESKHNQKYWTLDPYIGVGLGACSYFEGKLVTNSRVMKEYLNDQQQMTEIVSLEEQVKNHFIFGLRQLSGVNYDVLEKQYNFELAERFPLIPELVNKGLVTVEHPFIKLTKTGLQYGNQVWEAFV